MRTIRTWLEKLFLRTADRFFAILPQPIPGRKRLKDCRIISHRGVHDNRQVFENTFPAFDRALDLGIWGIEFDIRWTQDLKPVIVHDTDLRRIFGAPLEIRKTNLADLKAAYPLIPSLEETIHRYGKRLHLMAEIKEEIYPDPAYQHEALKNPFSTLTPRSDFHFLCLHPEMFKQIDFVPTQTFLPVAELNVNRLSALSLMEDYGGILGHYLLLTRSVLKKHQQHGQQVGTGFVNSKNCLFREINRGVTWIFTNNAEQLQAICDSFLQSA